MACCLDVGGAWFRINKTNGFRALMRVFREFYLEVGVPGDVVSEEKFAKIFLHSHLKDDDFVVDNFPPGSSGEGKLVEELRDILRRYLLDKRQK